MNKSQWAAMQTSKLLDKYCVKTKMVGKAGRSEVFESGDVAEIIVVPKMKRSFIVENIMEANALLDSGVSGFGIMYFDVRTFGERVRIHVSSEESYGTDLFFTTGSQEFVKLVLVYLRDKGWGYDWYSKAFAIRDQLVQYKSEEKFFKAAGIPMINPGGRTLQNEEVRLIFSATLNRLRENNYGKNKQKQVDLQPGGATGS